MIPRSASYSPFRRTSLRVSASDGLFLASITWRCSDRAPHLCGMVGPHQDALALHTCRPGNVPRRFRNKYCRRRDRSQGALRLMPMKDIYNQHAFSVLRHGQSCIQSSLSMVLIRSGIIVPHRRGVIRRLPRCRCVVGYTPSLRLSDPANARAGSGTTSRASTNEGSAWRSRSASVSPDA